MPAQLRAVRYYLEEAAIGVLRGWRSSLLAVVTVIGAVFVLGLLLLALSALGRVVSGWSESATLAVYLSPDATDAQRTAVSRTLASSAVVRGQAFVSPEEARARFARAFPELVPALDSFAASPFPPSLDVLLATGATGEADVAQLVRAVAAMPGVSDVRYDRGLVDRLSRLVGAVRTLGGLLVAFLALAAAIVVVSAVRLSYVARRDEIEVLLLVGAPFSAIRGPFLAEGWLQGTFGAVVAVGLLGIAYAGVRRTAGATLGGALGVDAIQFLSAGTLAVLVLASGLLGALAAVVAIGRPALDAD